MLRLKRRQREILADKVPDMANIIAGAIIIGFAVGEPPFSWAAFLGVVAFWTTALIFVLAIAEPEK